MLEATKIHESKWDVACVDDFPHGLCQGDNPRKENGPRPPRNVSSLHWAAENTKNAVGKLVSEIMEVAPGSCMDKDEAGRLPLHCAMNSLQSLAGKNAAILLEAYPEGAAVADNQDRLPLHYAAASRHDWAEEMVQALLEQHPKGALHTDNMGEIPLHAACRNSGPFSDRITKLLLDISEEGPKALDYAGRHPLHVAVRCTGSRSHAITEQLMKAYPKAANVPDSLGRTAVHRSAQARNLAAIELMVDLGADCNITDEEGLTALARAAQEGDVQVCEAVLKVDPTSEGRLKDHRRDEFNTKDIDFQGPNHGETALHLACFAKDVRMCEFLVAAGAERGIEDKSFKCPWDYADEMALIPGTEAIGQELMMILKRPDR